jgi:hypothetical protein
MTLPLNVIASLHSAESEAAVIELPLSCHLACATAWACSEHLDVKRMALPRTYVSVCALDGGGTDPAESVGPPDRARSWA